MKLLAAMAELRLATAPQLATWLLTSEQMVRRRGKKMLDAGLVRASSRGFGRRGRPESLLSLTDKGVALLHREGMVSRDVSCDKVTGEKLMHTAEHQILLNSVAIECARLHRDSDQFAVKFISSTSPHHLSAAGGTVLRDHVTAADGSEHHFTPDAAFCITRLTDGKSLLFFVEVDTGTESVSSRSPDRDADMRKKIDIYRTYLARRGYKRYENSWLFGVPLRGFRLLVLTGPGSRRSAICRLAASSPPSQFVWVGDHESLTALGLAGAVWSRGGREDMPMESVLEPRAAAHAGSGLPEPSSK